MKDNEDEIKKEDAEPSKQPKRNKAREWVIYICTGLALVCVIALAVITWCFT